MAQSEFVNEVGLELAEDDVHNLYEEIGDIVETLLEEFESHSRLEDILRDSDFTEVIKRADTSQREAPERFTERYVIERLFDELGFDVDTLASRTGDFADERGEETDYAITLNGERILVEAEPLNKNLEYQGVGLDQVESWLENRNFEADYGIATNGLKWVLVKYDEDAYDFDELADVDLRPSFIHQFETQTGKTDSLTPFSEGLQLESKEGKVLRKLGESFRRENLRRIVSEAGDVIEVKQQEITEDFYDNYIRLIFGVLDEETGERTERCLVRNGVQAPDTIPDAEQDVRLFSVSLMNRLVFIKFLEDKGIVEQNLLTTLKREHEEGSHPDDFYETYLSPLFYKVLNTKRGDRNRRLKNIGRFHEIPYLNGGLFTKTIPDEDRYEVSDSILIEIVELLEDYSFSTNGGFESLDPSILGNVFEKTINYLAGEEGQQKDLGAFYTPNAITRFCAEQTVHPILVDRCRDVLRDRDWPEAEVEKIETIEDLTETIPENTELVRVLLDEINDLTVLDPACGSGHFLTSVTSEIVSTRRALHRKIEAEYSKMELVKETVINNVYGVDIVPPAVEIAKLRLWLSIISELTQDELEELNDEEMALPNITFNIRQGNSLIGFIGMKIRAGDETKLTEATLLDIIPEYIERVQETRTTHEGLAAILEDVNRQRDELTESLDASYLQLVSDFTFEDTIPFTGETESIESTLQERMQGCNVSTIGLYVNDPLNDDDYEETLDDLGFTAYTWKAKSSVNKGLATSTIASKLVGAIEAHPNQGAIESIYIERTIADEDLDGLSRFHWIAEFPEAIALQNDDSEDSDSEPEFGIDVIIGNPPFGATIEGLQEKLIDREEFFTCHAANNSAEYFMERAIQLCDTDGRIGFVLPKSMSYYDSWREIRAKLFKETQLISLFDTGLAFQNVDYEEMTVVATPTEDASEEDEEEDEDDE